MQREITKEQYDRAMGCGGYIASIDEPEIFTRSELCGWGVYGARAFKKDDKYFVSFTLGSSCD